MKRIIPIFLIIVIISCIILPFSVSAITRYSFPYEYNGDTYVIMPISFTVKQEIGFTNESVNFNGLLLKTPMPNSNTVVQFYNYTQFSFIIYDSYYSFRFSSGSNASIIQYNYNKDLTFNSFTYVQGIVSLSTSESGLSYYSGCNVTYTYNNETSDGGLGLGLVNPYTFENDYVKFSFGISNYTLTFNSNGGTSIAPIIDIEPNSTINLVGQYGEYLPQFVPEKEFYDFSGWSLTDNGTNVSSVTVTQDTTLYANWVADVRNTMIIYDSANGWMNFYGDQNHTTSPPTLVISGNNVSINVYYEITSQVPNDYYLSYFNIEENGTIYRIMPEAFYINIIVDTPGYIQITPVFTQLRTLTVTYNPQGDLQDNTMEFGVLEPAYKAGTSVVLTGYYSYPMFVTNIRLVGNNSQKIYSIDINDSWDEQENAFYFEIMFTMPDENSHIIIYWSVMMGYPAQPTVSYDESGNPYFYGIDSEDIFNQDFSRANDLIPDEIIGFIEYFTYFEGLSVIITIILVAGFATYILRHSV